MPNSTETTPDTDLVQIPVNHQALPSQVLFLSVPIHRLLENRFLTLGRADEDAVSPFPRLVLMARGLGSQVFRHHHRWDTQSQAPSD